MVSRKNYNLNNNEGFLIFLTSKLITCFIGGFALIMKPQSIAHLINRSKHIYWILDLEDEMHSIWNLWVSDLQECKSNEVFQNRTGGQFSGGSKKLIFFERRLPPPDSDSPESSWGAV